MTHYIKPNADGSIACAGTTNMSIADLRAAMSDNEIREVDQEIRDLSLFRWVSESLVSVPPRPSANHDLDPATGQWVLNEAKLLESVRVKRNQLLAASDWVVARAYEAGTTVPTEWAAYRQALRDIPEQGDLTNIAWPTAPSS